MNYSILPTVFFLEQVRGLGEKEKRIVESKIELIKINPFRFKKIHSKLFSKVFRVRLTIGDKDSRLIYVVIEPSVILVCIMVRKEDYADLERYLKRIE